MIFGVYFPYNTYVECFVKVDLNNSQHSVFCARRTTHGVARDVRRRERPTIEVTPVTNRLPLPRHLLDKHRACG